MCGVIGGIGPAQEDALEGIRHRGPDAEAVVEAHGWWLGHTRLAIQDLDPRSDQPFRYGEVTLVYNGELWNADELRAELQAEGAAFTTTGDTEVMAAALEQWGVDALPRLNGMFAVAWVDGSDGVLRMSRDRYGEVPLHWSPRGGDLVFASELKALEAMGKLSGDARWVKPGEVLEVERAPFRVSRKRWHTQSAWPPFEGDVATTTRALLEASTTERAVSDVPVCCLLSGGIDSSAIVRLLSERVPGLVAYIAVQDRGSPDLRSAREVAHACGVRLREVPIPSPSSADLKEVVRHIEIPHKAQVEIGWACLVLARQIREDGFKVTFSGEGADELLGTYGFVDLALREGKDFHVLRKKLFAEQHRKNFARANKVFMAHGVECRLPFLNPDLVDTFLRFTLDQVRHKSRRKRPLTEAFARELPSSVIKRAKLAFQVGLGTYRERCAAAVGGDPAKHYRAWARELRYG